MLHAIKLVYSNGIIQDMKSGVVILKDQDGMQYEAMNVLPQDQLLITAITLHQLYSEHLKSEDGEDGFENILVDFIKALLSTEKQTKGDVLQ